MFVICKNDFPWAVCPEDTTEEQARHVAEVKQVEFNKHFATGCTRVYMHVQQVEMLTPEQIAI